VLQRFLTTEGFVSWRFTPVFDAAHRAALEAGKPLVYVCPPAAWPVVPLFARFGGAEGRHPHTVVIVPDAGLAGDLAQALRPLPALAPLHLATGLARTATLLTAAPPATLIATPKDALDLVARSALKLRDVVRVAVGWPEWSLHPSEATALDTLLAESGRAQRIVLTQDDSAITDFLARHAHRAPALVAARLPESPVGPARYLTSPLAQRVRCLAGVLDAANPPTALVWDPLDLTAPLGPLPAGVQRLEDGASAQFAVALDLPDATTFAALRQAAADLVVVLGAAQVPYLRKLAHPLRPCRVAGAADEARGRWLELRRELRRQLTEGDVTGALLALEPLFDEFDPALVAAAAVTLRAQPPPRDAASAEVPAFVRIRVAGGRKEHLRVGDIVGVLLNTGGLAREDVGRVDVRETVSFVEVRAAAAERALAGLNGRTVRGRRITARLERR
jgi:hypothetical protein